MSEKWKRIRAGWYERDDHTIAYNEDYKEWTLFDSDFTGIHWGRSLKELKNVFSNLFRKKR